MSKLTEDLMLGILTFLISIIGIVHTFKHMKWVISLGGVIRIVLLAATFLFLNLTEFSRPIGSGSDASVPYHLAESARGFPLVSFVKLRNATDIKAPANAGYLNFWTFYDENWLYARAHVIGNAFCSLALLFCLVMFEVMLANRTLKKKSVQAPSKSFSSHNRE